MKYTGQLVTGDFEDNTMTFEIEGEMILQAGKYEISQIEVENQVKKLGIANVSNCALFENEKLVSNMCISFRHDFGLLPKLIQEDLKRDCKEWLRAYENNKEHCC